MARTSGIVDEKLADYEEDDNFLVYGPSGCGKTVWAGTAENALFLAAERGTVSAARQGSTAKVRKLRTWPAFEESMDELRRGGYKKYSTLIVDSLTAVQNILWKEILARGISDNPARDPDIPYQQEYLKVQNVMKRVADTFVDIPVNVIFTALPMGEEDEDGEDLTLPQIHGKRGAVAQYVMGLQSCVGHMVTEDGERRIYWDHDPPHMGRDRYGILGPYTVDKSYRDIQKMIERSKTKTASAPTRRRSTGRRRSTSRKVS